MVTNVAVKESIEGSVVELKVVENTQDHFSKTIEDLGGTFSLKALCEKYNFKPTDVEQEIAEGKLISLGVDLIPAFQFVGFKKVENLEEVLSHFPKKVTDQEKIEFMSQELEKLKGRSIIYVLRKGATEKSLATIENEVKQKFK